MTASIPGGLDRFLSLSPLVVEEGGASVLSRGNLDTSGVLEFLREHQRRGGGVAVRQTQLKMQVNI